MKNYVFAVLKSLSTDDHEFILVPEAVLSETPFEREDDEAVTEEQFAVMSEEEKELKCMPWHGITGEEFGIIFGAGFIRKEDGAFVYRPDNLVELLMNNPKEWMRYHPSMGEVTLKTTPRLLAAVHYLGLMARTRVKNIKTDVVTDRVMSIRDVIMDKIGDMTDMAMIHDPDVAVNGANADKRSWKIRAFIQEVWGVIITPEEFQAKFDEVTEGLPEDEIPEDAEELVSIVVWGEKGLLYLLQQQIKMGFGVFGNFELKLFPPHALQQVLKQVHASDFIFIFDDGQRQVFGFCPLVENKLFPNQGTLRQMAAHLLAEIKLTTGVVKYTIAFNVKPQPRGYELTSSQEIVFWIGWKL